MYHLCSLLVAFACKKKTIPVTSQRRCGLKWVSHWGQRGKSRIPQTSAAQGSPCHGNWRPWPLKICREKNGRPLDAHNQVLQKIIHVYNSCAQIYVNIYTHVCMYVCMHACMYACNTMYVCMHACMLHACMHACMDACMHACMYAGMHACMYVCNVCSVCNVCNVCIVL